MSANNDHIPSTSGRQRVAAEIGSGKFDERLKLLYPYVDENCEPLPRYWSSIGKPKTIRFSQNNLRVQYKGSATVEASSVRTMFPIPRACGMYYFEVKIISKGKHGYIGIGLSGQEFRTNRLPGWDKYSYGYHGDDGRTFCLSGQGQPYGPTFTSSDVIGCCVNFMDNTCFYTKNGVELGVAFRHLPPILYPTVGLQTPGEEIDVNFGQNPFQFSKFDEMLAEMRSAKKSKITNFQLHGAEEDQSQLIKKLVGSYLLHQGYSQTAEAFSKSTGLSLNEDISSVRKRQRILDLVMAGNIGEAIELTSQNYPGLLEQNKSLLLKLRCQQFIEMIKCSDIDNDIKRARLATTASSCVSVPCSTTDTVSSNVTTVNSNFGFSSDDDSVLSYDANTELTKNEGQEENDIKGAGSATALPSVPASCSTDTNCSNNNSGGSLSTHDANTETITTEEGNENDVKGAEWTTASSNASCITDTANMTDQLNQLQLMDQRTASGDGPTITSRTAERDHKKEVYAAPSVVKKVNSIESILEFGKTLQILCEQIEKENKTTDEERTMIQNAFSLLAYRDPSNSPIGWQLCSSRREAVCQALNSAILESKNFPKLPPLPYYVAHANELLKLMDSNGMCTEAYVNINEVFPKK